MRGERTPLSNGLLFGLITGLCGGLFWALLVSVVPDEAQLTWRWIVVSGAFLFWFFVGFLVGAFNASRTAAEGTPAGRWGHSFVQRILTLVGWFFYRLLVGWFVGTVAMAVVCLAGAALWFVLVHLLHLDVVPLSESVRILLIGSIATSVYCCFSGGVFGALFGPRWSPTRRPDLSSRAMRSSFLAFLLGLPFGASLGWVLDEESRIFVCLAATAPIGILAGILGGVWTDIRNIQRSAND